MTEMVVINDPGRRLQVSREGGHYRVTLNDARWPWDFDSVGAAMAAGAYDLDEAAVLLDGKTQPISIDDLPAA